MKLEELKVYELAMDLGEDVWNIVDIWNIFQKDTVGKQLVKAADSVAANLSEGFGRYHYKETKNFGYYSRGSLFETKTWLRKANNREMISKEEYDKFLLTIETVSKMLNRYIKSIGTVSQTN